MRFFFLNPPDAKGRIYMKELGRCGRRSAAGEIWPQTGMAYLAKVARDAGAEVGFCDAMALGWTPAVTACAIRDFAPDFLFVHVTTPTFNNDREFCVRLAEELPSICIVIMGGHVSAIGGPVLKEFPADLALVGEGEGPIRALAQTNFLTPLNKGGRGDSLNTWQDPEDKSPPPPLLRGVTDFLPPGFCWLDEDGEVKSSGLSGLIQDLDSLPYPAWDLLPISRHKMPFFGREPFTTVISSRGCPYGCTFCRAGFTWGKRVRTRSASNVFEELRILRNEYRIRNIVFMTDSFTFDRAWVLELCRMIEDSTLGIRWICNSRVDAVDDEVLGAMKRAGCILISYGLESGSQKMLDSCRKGIKVEDSRRAIASTRKAGITSFGYFIFGLPGEDWDTVEETIRFALDTEPDYALFHLATPFPGTRLYEEVKEKGLLLKTDWALYDEETVGILRTEALTSEDLMRARKMAVRRFYLRPGRILRELREMRSPGQMWSRGRAAFQVLGNWLNNTRRCEKTEVR